MGFKSEQSYRVGGHPTGTATMFEKDKGLSEVQITDHVGKLLCRNSFKICNLSDVNSMDLTRNVQLIRSETKGWKDAALVKASQIGSHVKCAKSTTVVKRKNTIY